MNRELRLSRYLIDSTYSYSLWWSARRAFAANHTVIWGRFYVQGLLYQPVEELAPRTGFSPIKSKREFIQIVIQMVPTHRPLVSSKQPAFEQPCDQMNPGQQLDGGVLTFSTQNRNLMMVSIFFQAPVALPSIGMHDTAWLNGPSDELLQTGCRGIRNARHADSSNATTVLLCRNGYQRLSQELAGMRFRLFATDVGLIDLDPSAQPISARPNHRPSQFVQPRPSGHVAAQAQHPLQTHRAGSILLTSHIPHGPEPQTQWLACVLKNRPRSDRGLVPAAATDQPPTSGRPGRASLAARADKTLRPPKPDEVITTSLVRGKSILKFQQGPRVVFAHTGRKLPVVVGGVN